MGGEVAIIGLGGAIRDVADDATAFSHREYLMWLNLAMSWDDPELDVEYMEQTRSIVRDLRTCTGEGVYVNMLNLDETDRVVEAYGAEKYAKFGRVKAQYDPDNLLRMNYNITPGPTRISPIAERPRTAYSTYQNCIQFRLTSTTRSSP